MSQSRTRKSSSAANGEGGRTEAAAAPRMRGAAKAAGDSGAGSKARQPQAPRPAHSRSKVPKAVRDELENALVSLCDVWFEDIKPHLVLNNIKLHGHGASCAGAGGGGGGTASGDHARLRCSHADAAQGRTNCRLCILLSNAASGIESAISQAASALPAPAVPYGDVVLQASATKPGTL